MDLFEEHSQEVGPDHAPLAERMRPSTLDEFVGQTHLLGAGKLLRRAIEHAHTCSPHSVFSWPAQRPSRPFPGNVQGAQPMEAYPWSWSGW